MEQMKMHSPDLTQQNIEKIRELFPNCITEAQSADGSIKLAIDFDQLKQELSGSIVEGPQERYLLNWPGKQEALITANASIAKTLRPCRDESVDFDNTQNLIIEGDNLDALKLLQENFLGKVKMIYIDPPYNTGNDFIYEDDFSDNTEEFFKKSNQKDEKGNRLISNKETNGRFHSDWLSMIYSRLRIAINFLSDDGVIFISIDDNEVANLRKICDEIFGADNFISQLIWKKSYGGGAKSKHTVVLHEYILMYGKNKDKINKIELPPNEDVLKYYKFKDSKFDKRGPYRKQPLSTNSMDERPNLKFPIAYNGQEIWPEKQWQWSRDRVEKALGNDELVITKKSTGWTVDYKQYLKNEEGIIRGSKLYSIIEGPYTQTGTNEIKSIFGNGKVFTFPKPLGLLNKLLNCVDKDAVVLDFFAGSGVTADAVITANKEDGGNRKFILIQLPEACEKKSEAFKAGFKNISDITKERIRRSGVRGLEEDGNENWKKDVGFRVLKVDTSNMSDVYYTPDQLSQGNLDLLVDNIKRDRSGEDLLFQVMLDWGTDLLTRPIRTQNICGKTVFFVDNRDLIACFDMQITEELIKEIARFTPLRVIFRSDGFVSDAVKINADQIIKQMAPGTQVKFI